MKKPVYGLLVFMICEQTSAQDLTTMSFSYNIALAVFGGTTPLVATYLIKITNNPMAPAWYLLLAAVVSLVCLFCLKETLDSKNSTQ